MRQPCDYVIDTIITAETYLKALGLERPPGTLTDPEHRAALYGLVIEFLADRDCAEPASGPTDASGLDMRLMGTAVHVRLGAPTAEELRVFVALAALVLGAVLDPAAISAASVVSLKQRIGKTDARFGERSVVDAVLELGRATAADVVLRLYGKPCRHPSADCRYMRDGVCGLDRKSAEALVEGLVTRRILRQLTPAPPIEYRIEI